MKKVNFLFLSKQKNSSRFEVCVICHGATNVAKDLPIEMRAHYVSGVGQLCPECYSALYGVKARRRVS